MLMLFLKNYPTDRNKNHHHIFIIQNYSLKELQKIIPQFSQFLLVKLRIDKSLKLNHSFIRRVHFGFLFWLLVRIRREAFRSGF